MIRTLCLLFSLFSPWALAADGPPAGKAGVPAAKPARPEGVSIEFTPHALAESDRTPQGDRKAILAAMATLKTERPLRYRSTVIPPGAYPVKIAGEGEEGGGRNLFFVIGPAAGASQEVAGAPNAARPEEKKPEKDEEKNGASKGAGGRGRAPDRGTVKAPPGQIRALFHLTGAAKASGTVEFSVHPNKRGDRLTLTVTAGASQGKATLRFVE